MPKRGRVDQDEEWQGTTFFLHDISKFELIVGGKILTEQVCLNNHKETVLKQTPSDKL